MGLITNVFPQLLQQKPNTRPKIRPDMDKMDKKTPKTTNIKRKRSIQQLSKLGRPNNREAGRLGRTKR